MPKIKKRKYEAVLHYLIEKCGSKPNFGKTVLWKLLYFSDFDFYEFTQSHLTGEKYRNIKYGPAPENFDRVLKNLIKEKKVKKVPGEFGPYKQERFIALTEAEPGLSILSGEEIKMVDRVIERYGNLTASDIEKVSHKDIPVEATKKGECIDYDLAFYREAPFTIRSYENEN